MEEKTFITKWYDENGYEHEGLFKAKTSTEAKQKALKKYNKQIHYFVCCIEIKRKQEVKNEEIN